MSHKRQCTNSLTVTLSDSQKIRVGSEMEIWEFSDAEINRLAFMLSKASENNQRVRFAFDGGLKVKRGEGLWTYPLGHKENA